MRANAQVFVPRAPRAPMPLQIKGDLLIAKWADAMVVTSPHKDVSVGSSQHCKTQTGRLPDRATSSLSDPECAKQPSDSSPASTDAPSCAFPASGVFCPTCIDGLVCAFHLPGFARCAPDVYRWLHTASVEANVEGGKEPGCDSDTVHAVHTVHRSRQPPMPPPPPPPPHLLPVPPPPSSVQSGGNLGVPKWQDDGDASTDVCVSEPGYADSDTSDGSSPFTTLAVHEQRRASGRWVKA